MPADVFAREVAAEHGLDISAHRARQLTRERMVSNDLILVLDETHEQWINRRFPEFRGKTFRLGKWNSNRNIADPYGEPKAAFTLALREINEDVIAWKQRLIKRS
jgi:protein-tyrosine phosphatase